MDSFCDILSEVGVETGGMSEGTDSCATGLEKVRERDK